MLPNRSNKLIKRYIKYINIIYILQLPVYVYGLLFNYSEVQFINCFEPSAFQVFRVILC